jgi:hypothetical protein
VVLRASPTAADSSRMCNTVTSRARLRQVTRLDGRGWRSRLPTSPGKELLGCEGSSTGDLPPSTRREADDASGAHFDHVANWHYCRRRE